MDLYFLDRQGGNFKASVFHRPFFYVDVSDNRHLLEVSQHLIRRFEGCIVEQVDKEDLDLANHLVGRKHRFLKISFSTVAELMDCKAVLR
jgi:DNA polymerase epsilon subunit 1